MTTRLRHLLFASLVLTISSNLFAQSMKTFHFGHSLVQHDNEYSNLFHWMNELSVEAGYSYTLEGQFGFLANQGTPPYQNMGSTLFSSGAWDTDFATSDFDNTVITAAYYAHYEFNAWENAYGVVRLDEMQRIVDYARGETPDIKVYLYAPWTEPGDPTQMSDADFEYFKNDSRALTDWWITTQDTLNGSRQNLDAKLIPVGEVLANVLDNVSGMDVLTPTDIFVDDAGHGTPTYYFMAAMVHYMARWGEQCPASYTVPDNIHEAVRNNYTALITYMWNQLQTYNHPDGSSRVFFSADETAPSAPQALTATSISATTVDLSWDASTDENGVSSYRVYTDGADPISVTGTSVRITELTPNTSYSFTVAAGDRAGNWSEQSTPLQASTLDLQVYTLTVNNGTGSGDFSEGTETNITADMPVSGYEFDRWTGDIQYLESVSSSSTNLTMPAGNVTITATYTEMVTGDTITIEAEDYADMSGIQTEGSPDLGGGEQVGYIDNDDWIEFEIDFPTAGIYGIQYRVSSEGSVGDMSVSIDGLNPTYVDIPNTNSYETFTTTSGELNVSASGVQTLRITSIGSGWNINWLKLIPPAPTSYALSVLYGDGSGNYEEGAVVTITADAPDPGFQFYRWEGDVQYLVSATDAATTLTMPNEDIALNAIYSVVNDVSDLESGSLLYPNPVANGESLKVYLPDLSMVTITGINGEVVLQRDTESDSLIINTIGLKGAYFVIMQTSDHREVNRLLVVE